MKTLFQTGERVLVKNLHEGGTDCCFGVTYEMQDMSGEIVTISDVYELISGEPHSDQTTGRYCVLEDPDGWMWCDNCFEKLHPEINDIDFDVGELL